jgi:hypothetical protein
LRPLPALAAALLCGLIRGSPALADSPPYATTDTAIADRPELVSFLQSAIHAGAHSNTLGFDLAIPIAPRWELTVEPRFVEAAHGDRRAAGLGDTELAAEYLWLSETAHRPAIAIEPNLTLPTAQRGLGEGRVAIEMLLLIGKTFGPWKLSGQFGLERVGLDARADYTPVSLLIERAVTRRLSLGVEYANDLPMRTPGSGQTEVNAGATWWLREGLSLQAVLGRRLPSRDTPADFHSCLAFSVEL